MARGAKIVKGRRVLAKGYRFAKGGGGRVVKVKPKAARRRTVKRKSPRRKSRRGSRSTFSLF